MAQDKWTPKQIHRAQILFEKYPLLKQAYLLARKLAHIYQKVKDKGVAFTKLAQWYNEVEKSTIKSFQTISRSIQQNYQTI
ncbi:MAG: transposase, partial [Cyclobacteriaceae bacterium]